MTPIINISFSKHPMSWEINHCHLLRPSDSVMKSMCHNQTLTGLSKNCPKKLNKVPCTMCYTAKTTTPTKGTTIDTNNIQPGELIHMDFDFYNVISIRGFTSMITVVCAKTITIWVFHTASKRDPVHIIFFILTTLKNEQHPYKRVRVYEDGSMEKLT